MPFQDWWFLLPDPADKQASDIMNNPSLVKEDSSVSHAPCQRHVIDHDRLAQSEGSPVP